MKIVEGASINMSNYKEVARKLALPYNVLIEFINDNTGELNDSTEGFEPNMNQVAIYDIETDDRENFEFGYVNDKRFNDPALMSMELRKYPVIAGFNNFRFDNEILARSCPELWKETVMSGGFKIHTINTCIDLLLCYALWKPFKETHKLDELAKDLDIARLYNLSDKDNKCQEDIAICKQFYPTARQVVNWIWFHFKIDPHTLCSMMMKQTGKLRRWMLQSWMLQRGTLPLLIRRSCAEKPSYYLYAKPGYYKGINVFDVRSAYPTTAMILRSSLYKDNDFAEFEEFLMRERNRNPDIQEFIKWCCNAMIGDMNNNDAILRDSKIMVSVWNHFHEVMKMWIKDVGKKNIVYAYTDCIFTRKRQVPVPKPYEIQLKHKFNWLVIWNVSRILGLTAEGKIHKTHFNRKYPQLKLYEYLDQVVECRLKQDHKKFLKDPMALEFDLKSLPEDAFKMVIRKDSDTCYNLDLLEVWSDLNYGFNEVYLAKGRKTVTTKFSQISFIKYEKLIKQYLKLFKVKNSWFVKK